MGEGGALGDGSGKAANQPIRITNNVTSVSAGFTCTAAIKKDGSLWTWGRNTYGQLGDGTEIDKRAPVHIMDGVRLPANTADYKTEILNCREANGNSIINITAKNATELNAPSVIFAAVYSQTGKLKFCKFTKTTIAANSSKALELTLPGLIRTNDTVKLFLWTDKMKPLAQTKILINKTESGIVNYCAALFCPRYSPQLPAALQFYHKLPLKTPENVSFMRAANFFKFRFSSAHFK